jgi:hypothetical protein
MLRKAVTCTFAIVLIACTGIANACEYKEGETKFAEYAICRYGTDAIILVNLPEGSAWDQCVYFAEAFRPPKLLAVTKEKNGMEQISHNNRTQIGNACYLSKPICDQAYKAAGY